VATRNEAAPEHRRECRSSARSLGTSSGDHAPRLTLLPDRPGRRRYERLYVALRAQLRCAIAARGVNRLLRQCLRRRTVQPSIPARGEGWRRRSTQRRLRGERVERERAAILVRLGCGESKLRAHWDQRLTYPDGGRVDVQVFRAQAEHLTSPHHRRRPRDRVRTAFRGSRRARTQGAALQMGCLRGRMTRVAQMAFDQRRFDRASSNFSARGRRTR
jgi:hypothetical protein